MNKVFAKLLLITLFSSLFTSASYGQWSILGVEKFSNTFVSSPSIKQNNGTPYIVFEDGGKATVMKFDGTSWVPVGTEGFSPGNAFRPSLYLDNDTPYVAFSDGTNADKATVMKFDGINWVNVGSPGFSAGPAFFVSLKLKDSLPYVAFKDNDNGGKATVMKFDGINWVLVGNAGFTAGFINKISLDVDNSTPYVAFEDGSIGNSRATVMKFDGTNWVFVGSSNFTGSFVSSFSIDIDNGTPYVGYSDGANGSKATVRKFDGTDWVPVGTGGFSAGGASDLSFEMNNGTPYVGYGDGANSGKATVMKYDGSNWVSVGSAGFSSGLVSNFSLALSINSNPSANSNSPKLNALASSVTPEIFVVFIDGFSGEPLTSMIYAGSASISGKKFEDKNSNGFQDAGEPGIANWQIICNGDTTVTDSVGNYLFSNLAAGSYRVSEVERLGWTRTLPADSNFYDFGLSEGENKTGVDFGNHKERTAITGRKYLDKNGNGIVDPEDSPLAGVTIKLSTGQTTVTNSLGQFAFEGLQPGQYGVSEVLQTGFEQTLPANNGSYQVALSIGQVDTTSIFANKLLAAIIMGVKFSDVDSLFRKSEKDTLLSGWTIKAMYDGKTDSVLTDSNGQYTIIINFENPSPILVNLDETQKPGWVQTFPNDLPLLPPQAIKYSFFVAPGDTVKNRDFGNVFLGSRIEGVKFQDTNGNGVRDEQDPPLSGLEPGLEGWVIELNNGMVRTTNGAGRYEFDKLLAGNYTVSEVQKPNWTQTLPGGNGTYNISVGDLGAIDGIDFGNKPPKGKITGFLYKDNNLNGIKDTGDSLLVAWDVFIDGAGTFSNTVSTITDENGFYEFTNLSPEVYKLSSEGRKGWRRLPPTRIDVTLNGENIENINFGYFFSKQQIEGAVKQFLPDRLILDGLENWEVKLNGSRSSVTDILGSYFFDELEPNQVYNLTLTPKKGWKFVNPNNGSLSPFLPIGESLENQNFQVKPIAGSLFGNIKSFFGLGNNASKTKKLVELDASGLPPTPIEVILESIATEDGVPFDTLQFADTTDPLGRYEFPNVPLGAFTITPTLPSGWRIDSTSVAQLSGSIDTVGTTITNLNFIINPPATITGQKFFDLNGNGIQDLTEVGLDSVVIQLFDSNDNLLQEQATRSIDSNGDLTINKVTESGLFIFQPLTPGTYVVKEQVPTGWNQSFPTSATSYTINLTDGQIVDNILFGNTLSDSLDFGDLPAPYHTFLLDNGPKHKLGSYILGETVDIEQDGLPQAVARGDDKNGTANDEDGIVFTDELVAGSIVTLQVKVKTPPGKSGFLNGWIDFNQDGILGSDVEHIFTDTTLATGTFTLSYSVSESAVRGGTFARFRFSEIAGLLPMDFPPFANVDVTIGEVEDYIVGIDTIITAIRINPESTAPDEFRLLQNYPNPFNPSTAIQYSVKTATAVKLEIFNVLGQRVKIVVDKFQNAGTYTAVIDFNKLKSGVYFYRIKMDNFVASKKMLLVR